MHCQNWGLDDVKREDLEKMKTLAQWLKQQNIPNSERLIHKLDLMRNRHIFY